MSEVLARLLVGAALLATAWLMWWFIPRFTEWITPAQPPWRILIGKTVGAAVLAIPAAYVIIGAFS
jgi:hypothetical protein